MHPQLEAIASEFLSASERLARLRQGLPPEAWSRRPAPEKWSPGECVAHLNLTSAAFVPLLRQGLDECRRSGRGVGGRYRRDLVGWLLWRALSVPGRFKSKTTAAFVPSGDRPAGELAAEFERLQAEQIALTRASDGLPIDRVKIVSPFDGRVRYSIFAALSILPRHQHRHLWQAEQALGARANLT
ncbi:MAG TPA: DinB family protein [Vicinamibacterales bacterium]|nr:DinB family protein [Vicinamibacterales bacterium]